MGVLQLADHCAVAVRQRMPDKPLALYKKLGGKPSFYFTCKSGQVIELTLMGDTFMSTNATESTVDQGIRSKIKCCFKCGKNTIDAVFQS